MLIMPSKFFHAPLLRSLFFQLQLFTFHVHVNFTFFIFEDMFSDPNRWLLRTQSVLCQCTQLGHMGSKVLQIATLEKILPLPGFWEVDQFLHKI